MSNKTKHIYHLVDESPWPLSNSIGALFLIIGFLKFFYLRSFSLILLRMLLLILTAFQWWLDVLREGSFQGFHSEVVALGLRWGIIFFITSELCFFFSFFWCFFHRSLRPISELGIWPPLNIIALNYEEVPLLNTFILVSSGISVTWAHHALIRNIHSQTIKGLIITIIIGAYFTFLQGVEYLEASFRISDRAYGSIFFLATGFHGVHVIVGTLFLFVILLRRINAQINRIHHFGFEAAAWYWHFVDVVWLFLFITVYWWRKS